MEFFASALNRALANFYEAIRLAIVAPFGQCADDAGNGRDLYPCDFREVCNAETGCFGDMEQAERVMHWKS